MATMASTWRLVIPSRRLFWWSEKCLHYSKDTPSCVRLNTSIRYLNSANNYKMADSRKKARCHELTIGTHSGSFHCDEVLACFMLKQLPEYENAKIFRSRDNKELQENCDIIVDVGGVFDHERKLYDHHQKTFMETLSSLNPELGDEFQIRLSSAGLVYNFYGEEVIDRILSRSKDVHLSPANRKLVFIAIYRNFIREIDAIDNGVPMFENREPLYTISTHLSSRITKLNPSWDEENVNIDERFEEAMEVVGKEFVHQVIQIGCSWINAREYVRAAIESSKDIYESGEILLLPKFCPWKAHLSDLEKEYGIEGIPKLVIFSENEESWRVCGVPVSPDSFVCRKFLPVSWRGLREKELSEAAGISNLIFVHHTGFIGGAKTREAALEMSIKSVQMINTN